MSNPVAAAISGVVEGVTEFLPISSTGHLIVTSAVLNYQTTGAFEVIIQIGAIFAVLWFYRLQLVQQARQLSTHAEVRRFWLGVIVAFLPAAAIGFLLGDFIERVLFSPQVVAVSLIVGGIVLWIVESRPRTPVTQEATQITLRQSLIIGLAQLCALVPGVSRSASTIVGGMLTGLSRPAATTFSFYLSIPTLGGASLYSLLKDWDAIRTQGFADIAIGMVTSFVVALLAIGWLLRFISKNDFKGFAVYRIIAGTVILVFFALRG
ncbi:undecaprenyl-diphosphatase [Deinobacterium chartae]|uniref:Undecaprenyl-diphosphatase n=1 Tax=Deinobacterium chartae TaxID=521158 RepID=A0A841I0M9_9DEIO|nr:undecaprenyl-diphosphate phosphatase [Deinobacterium chartae]MBB6097990.1 undecaprenyl-diphosphatase [Deinobacterium chartae]